MSKINMADFYYGAVLSMLFNKHIKPALVEGDDDRQIYDLTTNTGNFKLYIKYSANKKETKREDYSSWIFSITEKDKKELNGYIQRGDKFFMALVCGVAGLIESEIALLDKDNVKEILELNKNSISISRQKRSRSYRIPTGGGRENDLIVKANRFEDIF